MSSWGGTMTANFVNSTGGTISNMAFSHSWNDGTDMPIIPAGSTLADGATLPLTIHVGEGGSDTWSVKFTDASGDCWYRDNKQCDVEQEDFASGKPVTVQLLAGNVGFSVLMPVSESCVDNYYDSCS